MAFELTIAEGTGRGRRFGFDGSEVSIGRDPSSDVVLSDPGVSRSHARIRRLGAAYVLLDGGSSNGTELNGAVLREPAPLVAGDRIGVGPVVFEFGLREAATGAQARCLPLSRSSTSEGDATCLGT